MRAWRITNACIGPFLGSIVIAFYIPWTHVLSSTLPTGGDIPAHPVLMQSVGSAFVEHLNIVHYSYDFWTGFELFQFYFPLPYLVGGVLARLIDPSVAFKLISIAGVIMLPAAFWLMAAYLGLPRLLRALASLLCISFLYTDAHTMWGGNIYSALSGMIANSWAFVFFSLAFGKIIQCRNEQSFSLSAVIYAALAIASHFYALLMLFILFCIIAVLDVVKVARRRTRFAGLIGPYAIGLLPVLLMAWWILPLFVYYPFSSELGGDWEVVFLQTLTLHEQIIFGAAVAAAAVFLLRSRFQDQTVAILLLYAGVNTILFFLNDTLNSTAFNNIRLWPAIYFSGFVILLVVIDRIYRQTPTAVTVACIAALWFLTPSAQSFTKASGWMTWNYSGIENKPDAADFAGVVDALRRQEPGRVSFELTGRNDARLGSSRVFEITPYVTRHEAVRGGIVNSASHPGVGYFLQCLVGEECAGWPPGSIMPEQDTERAIDMMRSLGIRYHIAARRESRASFESAAAMEQLYRGRHLSLFRLVEEVDMVEVFDGKAPAIATNRPLVTLVNLPRWDRLRNALVVFTRDGSVLPTEQYYVLAPNVLINHLIREWNAGDRVYDRGWTDRHDAIDNRINAFLFSWRRPLDYTDASVRELDIFVADRGFDPDVLVTVNQQGYSEVGIPLTRDAVGESAVTLTGRGYKPFLNERELPLNEPAVIQFEETKMMGSEAPFAMVRLEPIAGERYRYAEVRTTDQSIRSGLPGEAEVVLPQRVTDRCNTAIDKAFHRLTLRTDCVGLPHLIKYAYYPKWVSDVPIRLGTNGFMVLTPRAETTVLRHDNGAVDWIGIFISLTTLLALLSYCFRRNPFGVCL